jgi:DNA-binding transcriptional ArsR family regulator
MAEFDASRQRWSRLPSRWVHEEGLRRFAAGRRLGASSAALKLLVAITLPAENNASGKTGPNQGSVSLSYDQLMSLTDLSRAMVSAALKLLQSAGLVWVKREGRGRKNRYFLKAYGDTDPWAKIPTRAFYRDSNRDRIAVLHELSCRRESDMNALKLYLLFCAFRDRRKTYAMIGYQKISQYTGISEAKIRRAISVLIEHGLIRVDRDRAPDEKQNHPNRYEILGLPNPDAKNLTAVAATRARMPGPAMPAGSAGR